MVGHVCVKQGSIREGRSTAGRGYRRDTIDPRYTKHHGFEKGGRVGSKSLSRI